MPTDNLYVQMDVRMGAQKNYDEEYEESPLK